MAKKEARKAFADLPLADRRRKRAETKDKMSPLALKTLLKFYGRNKVSKAEFSLTLSHHNATEEWVADPPLSQNPSWQNLNDLARMTKLSPSVVRGFFKEKREAAGETGGQRRERRRRRRLKT